MAWQVTATTVQCKYVGGFAPIMVYPDGTAKCGYVNRNSSTKHGKKKLKKCKWPECPLVNSIRERVIAL